jgi:O-antigen/teichoic acid export membrane protein
VSLRFLSAYTAQDNRALIRGFLRRSDFIVGLASGTAAALSAAIVWIFRDNLSPSLFATYLVACALLPITAYQQVKALALQGLRRVVASQAPLSIMRPSLFGLGVILAVFAFGRHMTAASALVINCAASAVVLALSSSFLNRATKNETAGVESQYATREWIRVARGMFVVSAAQFVLSQNFDVVVVGSMLGTTVAGYYGAASQLAGLCTFGVNAVLFMAAPLISELFASGDKVKLQRLVTLTGRLNVAVSLPVVLALVFAGRVILSWYGPTFVTAYPVLLVLVAAYRCDAWCPRGIPDDNDGAPQSCRRHHRRERGSLSAADLRAHAPVRCRGHRGFHRHRLSRAARRARDRYPPTPRDRSVPVWKGTGTVSNRPGIDPALALVDYRIGTSMTYRSMRPLESF